MARWARHASHAAPARARSDRRVPAPCTVPQVDKLGGAALRDLSVLHAAGKLGDASLRKAVDMLTGSGTRVALLSSAIAGLTSWVPEHTAASLEALRALSEHAISLGAAHGALELPCISMAKAIGERTASTCTPRVHLHPG